MIAAGLECQISGLFEYFADNRIPVAQDDIFLRMEHPVISYGFSGKNGCDARDCPVRHRKCVVEDRPFREKTHDIRQIRLEGQTFHDCPGKESMNIIRANGALFFVFCFNATGSPMMRS